MIKELRLRNISSIEAGNAYAPEFMADYNQRFSVEPASAEDAHLPVRHDKERLKRILSVHSERKLSKNLEFHLDRCRYQITTETTGYRLRQKIVTVCNHVDGTTEVICDNEPLEYKVVSQRAIKKRESIQKRSTQLWMPCLIEEKLLPRPLQLDLLPMIDMSSVTIR